jgi:hypothetical protein
LLLAGQRVRVCHVYLRIRYRLLLATEAMATAAMSTQAAAAEALLRSSSSSCSPEWWELASGTSGPR